MQNHKYAKNREKSYRNRRKKKLQALKKIATMSVLLIACIVASIFAAPTIGNWPEVFQPGTHIATYANINVAPNPIGVGQTVNVNFYLASPLIDSSRPTNMTVKVTDPRVK